MKSEYEEEHIDRIFVPFAVRKKRSDLLRPSGERINKERSKQIRKYRMVVDYEPTFPDIRTAFTEFSSTRGPVGHILNAGVVTGALGAWCRLGMKTRVTVGSNLEIKLDAE